MLVQLTNSPYLIAAAILLTLGVILIVTGGIALLRARTGSFLLQGLIALLFVTTGALSGAVAFGIQGYQAFNREEVVANISVIPVAPQRFTINFLFPDGRVAKYAISGDELYIDAHILKWQPIANFFGLHTAYELDRVGGRYRDIEQERSDERTIYSLSQEKLINLISLRQRHTLLAMFFDAKYGSATFLPVTQAADFQLRVSTTGLLMREISTDKTQN